MVLTFDILKDEFFSAGGDVKKLGVSREYLDEVLFENILPPSPALLLKINRAYNVPVSVLLKDDLVSYSIDHPLLIASEALSFNKKFVQRVINGFGSDQKYVYDKNMEDKRRRLSDLVSQHYSSVNIRGRLSNMLKNFPSYFVSLASNSNQEVLSEFEFNYEDNVVVPRVCEDNQSIFFDEFIDITNDGSKEIYSVKEHFLKETIIKSISTNSSDWRPLFVDGSRRTCEKGNDFNKVFVEYKKPVPLSVLEALRDEVDFSFKNKYSNPDFFLLSSTGGLVLFDERMLLSKPDVKGLKTLYLKNRPAMSLEGDSTVGFYFYPQERETHSISSGAANRFYPGVSTFMLANRFQNYMENRVCRLKKFY